VDSGGLMAVHLLQELSEETIVQSGLLGDASQLSDELLMDVLLHGLLLSGELLEEHLQVSLILDLSESLRRDDLEPLIALLLVLLPLLLGPLASILPLEWHPVLLDDVQKSVGVVVRETRLAGQLAGPEQEHPLEFDGFLGLGHVTTPAVMVMVMVTVVVTVMTVVVVVVVAEEVRFLLMRTRLGWSRSLTGHSRVDLIFQLTIESVALGNCLRNHHAYEEDN
jgi:hypothetical protein